MVNKLHRTSEENRPNLLIYALRLLVAVQIDDEECRDLDSSRDNVFLHNGMSRSTRADDRKVLESVGFLQDSIRLAAQEELDSLDIQLTEPVCLSSKMLS